MAMKIPAQWWGEAKAHHIESWVNNQLRCSPHDVRSRLSLLAHQMFHGAQNSLFDHVSPLLSFNNPRGALSCLYRAVSGVEVPALLSLATSPPYLVLAIQIPKVRAAFRHRNAQ